MDRQSDNQGHPLGALEGWLRGLIREEIHAAMGKNGNHDTPQLFTAEQMAKFWGVPVTKVRRLARTDELHSVPLGHYVRFRPEDLEEYIHRQRNGE